jgi:hypothetical protein
LNRKLAIFMAWLLTATFAYGQNSRNDCGNENQPSCGAGDFEFANMKLGELNKCDQDLKEQNGVCVNDQRRLLAKVGGWLGFALAEQRYSIGIDERINRMTWLASHNAFSNVVQGFGSFLYTNHFHSITDQLNWGARHLELDPHYYGGPFNNTSRLCHASTTELCGLPGYASRMFSFALKEIDTWLNENPGEVIVIKLDDKNADVSAMISDIDMMLGPKIYRRPSVFTGWPAMGQIREAGKQVLIMQHGLSPLPGNNTTWAGKDYIQENNWPKNQNFDTCTGYDGLTVIQRNPDAWWDVAEGRSGLNITVDTAINFTDFDQATGLVDEGVLRRAEKCGVNIIGLDFINALDHPLSAFRVYNTIDRRNRAHIWSWEENDFGGTAAFKPSNRRWASRPAQEAKRLVCAPVRPPLAKSPDRNWRVTTTTHTWDKALGDNACSAAFNANGVVYVFSHPTTSWQNEQLGAYLASQGITEEVWLGYSSTPRPLYAIQPGELIFTTIPGVEPQSSDIIFSGPRGAFVSVTASEPWLKAGLPLGNTIPLDTGSVVVRAEVGTSGTLPAPGKYSGLINISVTRQGLAPINASVKVTLFVRGATTLTLTPQLNPVLAGSPLRLVAKLTSQGQSVNEGTVTVYRTSAPDPTADRQERNATTDINFDFNGLPVGTHSFAARFSGGDRFQPSASSEVTITVTPRITLSPSTATFTMQRNAALPAAQVIGVGNILPTSATITPSGTCTWLQTSFNGSNAITLTPVASASSLPAGSYVCNLAVSDAQSPNFGTAGLVATLNVRTTIDIVPASLNFLLGETTLGQKISVLTPNNDVIPLTATSNCPEVVAASQTGTGRAPDDFTIKVSRSNLQPTIYYCSVVFESPVAPSKTLPVQIQVVNATVVRSNPPGLRFVVDNAPYIGEGRFFWAPNSSHQFSTDTVQQDGMPTRYRFANWSNGLPQTHSITANANGGNFTVNYNAEHRLDAEAVPSNGGLIERSPFATYYQPGTTVSLRAIPLSGYNFVGWSGSLSGLTTQQSLIMSEPRAVTAAFATTPTARVTITSDAPGTQIEIAGGPIVTLTASLDLVQGRSYRFIAPPVVYPSTGVQWQFRLWDGFPGIGSNVVDYVVPANGGALNIQYRKFVLFTFTANPASGGTISNSGWQLANGTIPVQATPNAGFRFVGWSGGLTGATNPIDVSALNPMTAVANFAPTTAPAVVAMSTAPRSDGATAGTREVPIDLRNLGTGLATGANITGITNIRVVAGTGAVSIVTPMPVSYGDLSSNTLATRTLTFVWPSTATRVSFTVQFTANGGAYVGSTTLTLFR